MLDFTGGVLTYGYPLGAIAVKNAMGKGEPVAFIISSGESAEVVTTCLQVLQPWLPKRFMIDKSKAEIKALDLLGIQWLLCKFHMLQDWERRVKSAVGGVHGKGDQRMIIGRIQNLINVADKHAFDYKEKEFLDSLEAFPHIKEYYDNEWKPCAEHWAAWGREDVRDLKIDVNNYLERFFGILKYNFLMGKKCSRVEDLIQILTSEVIIFYMEATMKFLHGQQLHRQDSSMKKHLHAVKFLTEHPEYFVVKDEKTSTYNCKSLSDEEKEYVVVLGELSCSCEAGKFDICKHLEAAAILFSPKHHMRHHVAQVLLSEDLITLKESKTGLFQCKWLCDKSWKPCTTVVASWYCSCNDHARHKICCHLLAAMGHEHLEESLRELMADYVHTSCDEEEINDVVKFWDAKCQEQPTMSYDCMAREMLYLRQVSLCKKQEFAKSEEPSLEVVKQTQRKLQELKSKAGLLKDSELKDLNKHLDHFLAAAESRKPQFVPTHKREKRHYTRKADDPRIRVRKHKCL